MENIKTAVSALPRESLKRAKQIIGRCAYFAAGIALASTRLFALNVPFAVSLTAAAPPGAVFLTAAGACLAAFFRLGSHELIRTVVLVAAAALIKFIAEKADRLPDSKRIMPLAVLALGLISGGGVIAALGFNINTAAVYLCDSVLCSGACAAFAKTLSGSGKSLREFVPDIRTLFCVAVSACIILISLVPVELAGFHPARCAAVIAVCLAAYLFAETGGSVAGICTAVACAAAGSQQELCVCYALTGLLAGFFSRKGQLAESAAVSVTAGACALLSGTPEAAAMLAESAAAAVIFLLFPKKKLDLLRFRLNADKVFHLRSGFSDAPQKLSEVACALDRVNECIKSVSAGIAAIAPDENEIITETVRGRVCAECPVNNADFCPEKGEFAYMTRLLREKSTVSVQDFPEAFTSVCPFSEQLSEQFNSVFACACASGKYSAETDRCRELACAQLGAVSHLVREISSSLEGGEKILYEKERAAKRVFEEAGINALEITCTEPVGGAVTVKAVVENSEKLPDLASVCAELERALGVELTAPEVTREDKTVLVFERKAVYGVRLGSASRAAGGARLSGDYFECFSIGAEVYLLLSDGMGTGGRAAIDSAMTVELFSKLIRAGVSPQTALEITNTALIVKSDDESLSTLDAARINLFTGDTQIYKAGGAPSFYRCSGGVKSAALRSMPLGILISAQFSTHTLHMNEGDVLLIMSDGVCQQGKEQWIGEELLLGGRIENAGDFAQRILERATEENADSRDDMTVIAAVLKRE